MRTRTTAEHEKGRQKSHTCPCQACPGCSGFMSLVHTHLWEALRPPNDAVWWPPRDFNNPPQSGRGQVSLLPALVPACVAGEPTSVPRHLVPLGSGAVR